jgi:hypothetical protein
MIERRPVYSARPFVREYHELKSATQWLTGANVKWVMYYLIIPASQPPYFPTNFSSLRCSTGVSSSFIAAGSSKSLDVCSMPTNAVDFFSAQRMNPVRTLDERGLGSSRRLFQEHH